MQHFIYHKNKHLTLPAGIEEITGKQLIGMAAILHSKMLLHTANIKMLRILSGLNAYQWWRVPADAKLQAIEYIQWVYEDFKISNQLLPVYKKFYGVKSELENFTLIEFYFSERYYVDYISGDEHSLNLLIAVLYRKKKLFYNNRKDKDGDIRTLFNANLVIYYADIISEWPKAVRQAILLFYDGCRAKISERNPKIFTSHDKESNNKSDMFGILRGLSGGKYGDLEKVEKMYLHTALMEMNMSIDEAEEMKSKTAS